VAEQAPAASPAPQPPGQGLGFYTGSDGYVYCDQLRVDDVRASVPDSPFYLYSHARIARNYADYQAALEGLDAIVGYAVKANNNLFILKQLQALGSGAVLVSGNELKLAMLADFDPTRSPPPPHARL
jgi:diaminopimelate decarboxylase